MLAIAVFVCGYLIAKAARRIDTNPEEIYDLIFWVVIAGVIGCRIFFILLNFDFFWQNPLETFMIQNGGLAWQGGLVFGLLTYLWYCRRKNWPALKLADLIAPYLALGQAIGRWGCFLNGCCYGKEVGWGIWEAHRGIHAHPTQIYLSFAAFVSFLILKKAGRVQKFDGRILILYFILEAVSRFTIEFYRADHTEIVFGLSIFQIVCIAIFITSVYAYAYLNRRRRV